MKKILLLIGILITTINRAQLAPVAQALYTETYNHDVTRGQYAVNNGAQFYGTADGNSFYLKWFPASTTPSLTPLMITMHGTTGNVFDEFYLWHQKAMAKGVGIIAIQWYRGAAAISPNDYFDDPVIYSYIDTALRRIKYPPNKALLHGFSRGSARSYAIAYYDSKPVSGRNYFCTVMSNSGKADSIYPLYAQINSGTFGHSLYNGKKWGMFCGGQDPSSLTCCWAMNNSKNWVISNGGNVGLYISDPALGHGGFMQTPAYMDSLLNYYMPCFTNPTGINEFEKQNNMKLFPNPVTNYFTITTNDMIGEVINIYNCLGVLRKQIKIDEAQTTINVSDFDKGIYFVETGNLRTKFIKE